MNILLKNRTQSDNKAITQALKYLRVNKSVKEVAREVEKYQKGLEA